MELLKDMHLLFLAFGLMLFSISLHYRKDDEKLEYGNRKGFAQNLTTKGRVLLFIGVGLTMLGLSLSR